MPGIGLRRISAARRIRLSTEAVTKSDAARRAAALASMAAISVGQLGKPSSRAMTSWAAARVTGPPATAG